MSTTSQASQRIDSVLQLPEVKTATGLSRSSIYAVESNNLFPRRLQLGPRTVGWLESEIRDWVAIRASRRRAPESQPASTHAKA